MMCYRIEEKPEMMLLGYQDRFRGCLGDEQEGGEHDTVDQQLTDFYFAYQFPTWPPEGLEKLPPVFLATLENVPVSAGTYLVCETERCEFPTTKAKQLRRKAVSEWLPTSGYVLRDAPHIAVILRDWEKGCEEPDCCHYCEVWLPIEKK